MSKAVLYKDISYLMTMKGAVKKQSRNVQEKDLGVIKGASLVVEAGRVIWVGAAGRMPSNLKVDKAVSLKGQNVFPGFVDCHTHLVFAGDRTDEFELRNKGFTYALIAKKGGGILSTVKATRKASLDKLTSIGQARVDHHLSQGVTTIEVKSGYGLNSSSELKILKAINNLKKAYIVPTFLGAHAIPKEFRNEKTYLIQLVKDLEKIKKQNLSSRVDVFIEKGYFSCKQSHRYLRKVKEEGFDITIHADQLNRTKATLLAIELGAQSADHVICLSSSDKKVLAKSETTAVLLPTADFYLKCDYPDARSLIDQGGRVALATDFNPGSSPTQNISLVGLLARLEMKMTLPEVFTSMTVGGAYALGLEKHQGALLSGYDANFFVSPLSWKSFFYDMKAPAVLETYVKGRRVFKSNASFNF